LRQRRKNEKGVKIVEDVQTVEGVKGVQGERIVRALEKKRAGKPAPVIQMQDGQKLL